MYVVLATRDPRHASDFATLPGVVNTIAQYMAVPMTLDPLGFDENQSRSEDARQIGIGKLEKSLVCAYPSFDDSHTHYSYCRYRKYTNSCGKLVL